MKDEEASNLPLDAEGNQDDMTAETIDIDDAALARDAVREKLADALTPGYQAEFDPAEAEAAGAFAEDALSEDDALDSVHDYVHFATIPAPLKS